MLQIKLYSADGSLVIYTGFGTASGSKFPGYETTTEFQLAVNTNANSDTLSTISSYNQTVFDSTAVSDYEFSGFTTQWTVAAGASITLPLVNTRAEGSLSYNCTVRWGDGTESTVTAYNDANRVHTYTNAGTYNVEIVGTCEGWSFNNAGDKTKIVAVLNFGNTNVFNGFKYLKGGFYGCTNLTSLGTNPIPASGTGVLTDGFYNTFQSCTSLASIPTGLFDLHKSLTTNAFRGAFSYSGLTSIPTGLFDKNIGVTTYGFQYAFQGCTGLASIPTGLFDKNTGVTTYGFQGTFYGCTGLTSIPTDLFKKNTSLTTYAFYFTFYGCTGLTSIPTDIFRYNIGITTSAFYGTFYGCTKLTTLPTGLFDYNTSVSTGGFYQTFYGCTALATVPVNLFRLNTAVTTTGFYQTFYNCPKLQINQNIFYADGEESTRFLNKVSDFTSCFTRTTFTGSQGTAPDLWACNFGEGMIINVAPATDWAANDVITGQTSGATCVVVSKTNTTYYKVLNHQGTFTSGEQIGVTGVPAKLAQQKFGAPTFTGTPVATTCYSGIGNSGTSLSNYASIPATWL